jgi:hypothetical protein
MVNSRHCQSVPLADLLRFLADRSSLGGCRKDRTLHSWSLRGSTDLAPRTLPSRPAGESRLARMVVESHRRPRRKNIDLRLGDRDGHGLTVPASLALPSGCRRTQEGVCLSMIFATFGSERAPETWIHTCLCARPPSHPQTPLLVADAHQSHSIQDNLVALLGALRAWNCSAGNRRS